MNLLRRRLRSRTVFTLLADSGTSVAYTIKALLSANQIPLHIHDPNGRFVIQPSIYTNSLAVAEEVVNHKSRRNLELTVLGGTERPERRSLISEMTVDWARHINSSGKLDLAILGATGIAPQHNEDPSLYGLFMDNEIECRLKSHLLSSSTMKIVVADSSKIISGSYTHSFSSVSGNFVDLIVTDNGQIDNGVGSARKTSDEDEISRSLNDFSNAAAENNVAVIQVGPLSK